MVSVCLPSDALSQHLPSYLGFSYFGRGVSLHGCSSKAQLLLLTFDVRYFPMATAPDLGCGVSPLTALVPRSLLSCATQQVKKQLLELDMEQQTGYKLGKEYAKAGYCHPACLT